MMKITRERRKYRISNPYDEKQKLQIKERKAEEWKKKKKTEKEKEGSLVESHSDDGSCDKNNNVAEKFMKIYKKYLEQNKDLAKCEKENECINETKKKTIRRKKIKKLNFKLNKNNLLEKLIKNKAFMQAKETISTLPKGKCKDLCLINGDNKDLHKFAKNASNTNFKIVEEKSNVNNKPQKKKKKNRDDIIKEYDKILSCKTFLQNPLEYAKNVIQEKGKNNLSFSK
ncbi:conserved Plasmodium protein, unknown function [Plasmodium ovale wallikeri]|uniref:Uncharacterized protein n=1 Tax=Plasmodium ovale wallikeri TaxID=864142 RepID=A0A1A9AJU1_PLAOA|nr:conserved Plasmodium protein, unknown function [Plasmodium ovale wallikeri]SBT56450.1 conserved Plasmodium protein, unknown function [Plasmodium ovale wallikeri]